MKQIIFLAVIVFALFLYLKKTRVSIDTNSLQEIYRNNKNILAIDVRSTYENKINPAHGALNIPLNEIENSKLLPDDKNKEIWLFCESGARSTSAKSLLVTKGYKNIKNIGSWRNWNLIKSI
jgi:rhodanese-related sulfurtransferase